MIILNNERNDIHQIYFKAIFDSLLSTYFYFSQSYWVITHIPYSSPVPSVPNDEFEWAYLDVQPPAQHSIGAFSSPRRIPSCPWQSASAPSSCPGRWSAVLPCKFDFSRHFIYKWNHTNRVFASSFCHEAFCFWGSFCCMNF